MDSIKDLLNSKASKLDLDSKRGDLNIIQEELDRHFDGKVLVASFKEGTATLHCKGSSYASEVRLMQNQLKQNLNILLKDKIKKFRIYNK